MGIEVANFNFGVVISKRKYALDLLEEIGMSYCKHVEIPMDMNVKLVLGLRSLFGTQGDIEDL